MASKSRRRRKRSLQSKKGKRRGISTATQQPVAQTYKPAAPPVQEPAPTVARYPNIATDLRRTGILAGILLTALGVLAFVLS